MADRMKRDKFFAIAFEVVVFAFLAPDDQLEVGCGTDVPANFQEDDVVEFVVPVPVSFPKIHQLGGILSVGREEY